LGSRKTTENVNQVTGLAQKPHPKSKHCPKIVQPAPSSVPLERPTPTGRPDFSNERRTKMKQVQRGFTLIELVMVIVILGVLAAVAIPKFVDLRGDAVTAATQGVAGGLSSASSVNFAARSARGATAATQAIANCTDVANALQSALPTGYTITAGAVAAGTTVQCTLTNANVTPSVTAAFTAVGIL
jgi:prepilin-type N-terminal cleavage/methylation domain-containing protein